jgi:hypothetical protein
VDINGSIEGLVKLLRMSPVAKRAVTVEFLPDPSVPSSLWGGRSCLVRAVLNLTVNSMKFTDAGRVCIRTMCLSSTTQSTMTIRVEVIDTGRGMTQEEATASLQPYTHCAEKRRGGLGLGLTIVAKSIEGLGGKFEMQSKVGRGTHISFELDFTTAPERMLPMEPSANSVASQPKAQDQPGAPAAPTKRAVTTAKPTPSSAVSSKSARAAKGSRTKSRSSIPSSAQQPDPSTSPTHHTAAAPRAAAARPAVAPAAPAATPPASADAEPEPTK